MIVSEKELYKYLLKKGVSHNHAIGMINNIYNDIINIKISIHLVLLVL